MTDHNQLTINRIGGGKSSLCNLGINFLGVFSICFMLLTGCNSREQHFIYGVEVGGTPWEFAARIADNEDSRFVPECVRLITTDKAYIEGWVLDEENERPATLVCDVKDGKVVDAVLLDEIME